MKKYKYVPWNKWGSSILDHPEWKADIKRFFMIAENPTNDDEKFLRDNINAGHWENVFYYWTHNFDTNWTTSILAKFLDEYGIDFMKDCINPENYKKYFLDGEIVEVDE